jgi:glycosyltransferase involved in cell wall biosynthesis
VRNLIADLWWTAVELPRRARAARADVIHHPLPAWSPAAGLPQVVTVLDLAFERLPEHFDRGFRTFAHHAHRAAALRAGAVVCVSETTANDARALWAVPAARIVVAHLGPGQDLASGQPARQAQPRHFLYVGDDEPRKNLRVLLAAYGIYRRDATEPLDLVLAGSAGTDTGTEPGIRIERDPGPGRLADLYLGAAALVHPSLYEGFGLTPLEAMSLGTPVLAGRSPGVMEVCGDAAQFVDPRDPSAFAVAMAELAGTPALREDLGERGRRRAAGFSWSTSALDHLDAYSLALERTRT